MFSIKSLNGNSIYEIAASIEDMIQKEREKIINPYFKRDNKDYNEDELNKFLEEFDILNTKLLQLSKKSDFDVVTSVSSEYNKEIEYIKNKYNYNKSLLKYLKKYKEIHDKNNILSAVVIDESINEIKRIADEDVKYIERVALYNSIVNLEPELNKTYPRIEYFWVPTRHRSRKNRFKGTE